METYNPGLVSHICDNLAEITSKIKKVRKDGFIIGKRVTLKADQKHQGVIVGYNEKSFGFYSGNKYPIIVKLDNGSEFEYDEDSLILS